METNEAEPWPENCRGQPLIGNCRSRNVTSQVLPFLALIHGATHPGMQAKAVGVGAACSLYNAGVRTPMGQDATFKQCLKFAFNKVGQP